MTNKQQALITLNAGSSSIKFALYAVGQKQPQGLARGAISDIGQHTKLSVENQATDLLLPEIHSHQQALAYLLNWVELTYPSLQLVAAGHRVVHGGAVFGGPARIDPPVREQLQSFIRLAPLHMPHNLAAIDALHKQQPTLPQIACFDTAFHHTMSWNEQHYALPHEWFEKGARRYGFHGLSYEYIASVLPTYLGDQADARVIVAHLGHGASLCAMYGRKSVATTMGFTPLGGIPMATRSGDIDPGLSSWLIREAGLSIDEIDDLLNHQSGLLAISGISGDMRVLLVDKSEAALQAIDYFVHHTHRAIASLAAVLGGLDALIFTAGIGENSATIREQICRSGSWLGLSIDDAANTDNNIKFSLPDSKVSLWCIPTNEEIIIARHTRSLLMSTDDDYVK